MIQHVILQSSLKSRDQVRSFNLNSDDTSNFHSYTVYVTTFLGFGANSALGRHKEDLLNSYVFPSPITQYCAILF